MFGHAKHLIRMENSGAIKQESDAANRAELNSETDPSFSNRLLDRVHDLRFDELPEAAVTQVKASLLDLLGVALAGWSEPESSIVHEHVVSTYAAGAASVIGAETRVTPEGAALANGTLAHALDYDDTSWTYIGHASAVLVPAALAIGEVCGSSGRELVSAYTAGLEVAARVGESLTDEFAGRGWHLTSTIGVLGAAVAAARLLGLDREQLGRAFGIAASRASGLKANFGYTVKPLHAGMAAADGLSSALLAQAGLTANPEALEDRLGFFSAFAGMRAPEPMNAGEPLAIVTDGVAFKRYPSCTGSHPALDAVLAIVSEEGVAAADIESIRVGTTPEVPGELLHPWPANGAQAKFSMGYAIAVALTNRRVGLDCFSDEIVADEAIGELIGRCEVFVDPNLERSGNPRWPAAAVTITTTAGETHHRRVDAAKGNPGNELTSAELEQKFFECAATRLPDAQATALRDLVARLEQVEDIGELLTHARGI